MNCSNCGEPLFAAGGKTGWTFRDRPGKTYCAKCAGQILYPTGTLSFPLSMASTKKRRSPRRLTNDEALELAAEVRQTERELMDR